MNISEARAYAAYLVQSKRETERQLELIAKHLREGGYSWTTVGEVTGLSEAGARKKYGRDEK